MWGQVKFSWRQIRKKKKDKISLEEGSETKWFFEKQALIWGAAQLIQLLKWGEGERQGVGMREDVFTIDTSSVDRVGLVQLFH